MYYNGNVVLWADVDAKIKKFIRNIQSPMLKKKI